MNDKIAELRARASADPRSRHFYPLGEELRKSGALDEAESVLREGLATHPNYLSAWISLGRVLRDQNKHREAIDILQRAFSLDGSNVVTARLMAESYLELGERVEAIKKFKLVRALLPPDEEVAEIIANLERDIAGGESAQDVPAPELADDDAGASEVVEPPAVNASAAPEPIEEEPPAGMGVVPADEQTAVADAEPAWSEPGDAGEADHLRQESVEAESREVAPAAEPDPFEMFGDDTLTRAASERGAADDPFGADVGDETLIQSSGDAPGVEASASARDTIAQPFEDQPFGSETVQPADPGFPPQEPPATARNGAAGSDAAAARVVRLSEWLEKLRRNAGVP